MYDVVIITSGGKKEGIGHIIRSHAVADSYFKNCKTAAVWLTSSCVMQGGAEYEKIIFEKTCRYLKQLNPEILISDLPPSYNRDTLSKAAKALGIFHVGIDDMFLSDFAADLYVSPNPVPIMKKKSPSFFSGARFVILNKSFNNLKKIRIKKRVKRLLISMGGSDPRGVTKKILIALLPEAMRLNIQITVIVGPAFSCDFREFENNNIITIEKSPENMAANFLKSDIAFLSGGITSYEACFSGLPSIVITQNRYQKKTASELHKQKALLYLGNWNSISSEKTKEIFNDFCSDYEKRKDFSMKGRKLIDGKGAERLINLIDESYENRK